jgi:hypothetical protein
MSTERDGASAPPGLRHASVVAFLHTPVVTAALVLWLMLASDGYPEPMRENLLFLLPASVATALASSAILGLRGVRGSLWLGGLVALAATFGVAFTLEAHSQNYLLGDWSYLFLALPVPLVLVALMIGARVPRERFRVLTAWAVVVAVLLITDSSMRYALAQLQQRDAFAALADYDTVAVLDAPGWTLTHAYAWSAFPELVYRDPLGRTVLLGSTRVPLAGDGDSGGVTADMLANHTCTTGTEADEFVVDCEVRSGLLVVRMEGAYTDREVSDDSDRWPFGWTEVRMEAADGRYVRLRSDSPGVDLVALAGAIDEVAPTAPEAAADKASCLLRCPVWLNHNW